MNKKQRLADIQEKMDRASKECSYAKKNGNEKAAAYQANLYRSLKDERERVEQQGKGVSAAEFLLNPIQ